MISVFTTMTILLTLGYSLIISRYLYYWSQIDTHKTRANFTPTTTVSVVVAARNEAANIASCLNHLLAQNYPKQLLEIIVVDDHSEDQTAAIVQQYKVTYLALTHEEAGKKAAIAKAIQSTNHTLIITTDADCKMGPNWIKYLVSLYEDKKTKLIAAPVIFEAEKTTFEHFQSLDFMGMMGVAAAGVKGGFMQLCNGANLAYERAVFEEVNGFEGIDHLASGDDMLLMEKIVQKYPTGLAYLKQKEAVTITQPKSKITDFLQQRLRWATKSGSYQSISTKVTLGVIWLLCWLMIINVLLGVVLDWLYLYLFISLFTTKAIWDYIFLKTMSQFFGKEQQMKFFLTALLWHWWYIVVVGTWSLFQKKYQWKGRSTQ